MVSSLQAISNAGRGSSRTNTGRGDGRGRDGRGRDGRGQDGRGRDGRSRGTPRGPKPTKLQQQGLNFPPKQLMDVDSSIAKERERPTKTNEDGSKSPPKKKRNKETPLPHSESKLDETAKDGQPKAPTEKPEVLEVSSDVEEPRVDGKPKASSEKPEVLEVSSDVGDVMSDDGSSSGEDQGLEGPPTPKRKGGRSKTKEKEATVRTLRDAAGKLVTPAKPSVLTMAQAARKGVTPGVDPQFKNGKELNLDHTVFIDVGVKVRAIKEGETYLNVLQSQLLLWYQRIRENVAESFTVLRYKGKEAFETDALHTKEDLKSLKTLTQYRSYFGNLRVSPKGNTTAYLNIRVGFDADNEAEAIQDMNMVVADIATVYRSPLQKADTVKVGFLFPSHKGQDEKIYTDFFNIQLQNIHEGHIVMSGYIKPADDEPPMISATKKPIWNGMTKKDRDEYARKHPERDLSPVTALHIFAEKRHKRCVMIAMDFILNHPNMRQMLRPECLLVTEDRNAGVAERAKLLDVIDKCRSFQRQLYTTSIDGARALDLRKEGSTLRRFIMNMKRDGNSEKFLFVDCNLSWDGLSYEASYSVKFKVEGHFKATNMAAYVHRALGDPGLKWFTADMKSVKTLGWDEANNRPHTAGSRTLDSILDNSNPVMNEMFDFSQMEKTPVEDTASRPDKEQGKGDDVSDATFSNMSKVSKFYNADGTPRAASGEVDDWAGLEDSQDQPPTDPEEAATVEFFNKAVNARVESALQEQETRHRTAADHQQKQIEALQLQMQELLKSMTSTAGVGDDDSAPPKDV